MQGPAWALTPASAVGSCKERGRLCRSPLRQGIAFGMQGVVRPQAEGFGMQGPARSQTKDLRRTRAACKKVLLRTVTTLRLGMSGLAPGPNRRIISVRPCMWAPTPPSASACKALHRPRTEDPAKNVADYLGVRFSSVQPLACKALFVPFKPRVFCGVNFGTRRPQSLEKDRIFLLFFRLSGPLELARCTPQLPT